jgi:predicted nucleic acid-binding protein
MQNLRVCVDASLVVKLAAQEEDSDKADALWANWDAQGVAVIAPALLYFEFTSALWRKVQRGLLSAERARQALDTALLLGVETLSPPDLHSVAWDLAAQFHRPAAYDSHYLALAQIAGCDFWTADERLYNSVHPRLPWVHWLGDYQPTLAA